VDISLIWNFLLADATATFGDWHLSVRLSVCDAGYCERNNEHSRVYKVYTYFGLWTPQSAAITDHIEPYIIAPTVLGFLEQTHHLICIC